MYVINYIYNLVTFDILKISLLITKSDIGVVTHFFYQNLRKNKYPK